MIKNAFPDTEDLGATLEGTEERLDASEHITGALDSQATEGGLEEGLETLNGKTERELDLTVRTDSSFALEATVGSDAPEEFEAIVEGEGGLESSEEGIGVSSFSQFRFLLGVDAIAGKSCVLRLCSCKSAITAFTWAWTAFWVVSVSGDLDG